MSALASTDVTVTCAQEDVEIVGKLRIAFVTIAFGDGALTYPSGGVPMPAVGKFGMVRNLRNLKIVGDTQGIIWKHDPVNHTLLGFEQGVTVSAAGSATLDDYLLNSTNDATISHEISVGLSNDAGAGTYYLGKLKELNGNKVPAQVLYGMAYGW